MNTIELRRIFWMLLLAPLLPKIIFGYQTKVTQLDENAYPSINGEDVTTLGSLSARKHNIDEKDIAVLTLNYGPDEIGTDQDASILLARKEAGKIGGNGIYFISSNVYKHTGVIASQTYRVVRIEKLIPDIEKKALQRKRNNVSNLFQKTYGRPATPYEAETFANMNMDDLYRFLTLPKELENEAERKAAEASTTTSRMNH